MSKKTVFALVSLLVLASTVLPLSVSAAADTHLVKSKGLATIYALVDGKKMAVPKKAFKEGIFDKKDIEIIPYKELTKIPRVKYVSSDDSQKVYSLSTSGKRTLIGTEASVSQIIQDAVVEIPVAQIDMYSVALPSTQSNIGSTTSLKPGEMIELVFPGQIFREKLILNDLGQVASGNYLWDNGVLKQLGNPGNCEIVAVDMNNKSQIIGKIYCQDPETSSLTGSRLRTFMWENGVYKVLQNVPSNENVIGITEAGVIWGYKSEDEHRIRRIFMLKDGVKKYFDPLYNSVDLRDVNDAGQMIGIWVDENAQPPVMHSLFWDNGVLTKIPNFNAVKIYDDGTALGFRAGRYYHWKNGSLEPIQPGTIYGKNSRGITIGAARIEKPYTDDFINSALPTIWWNNYPIDFLKIFPLKAEWGLSAPFLYTIRSINNSNHIVFTIWKENKIDRAFLVALPDDLTPYMQQYDEYCDVVKRPHIDGMPDCIDYIYFNEVTNK